MPAIANSTPRLYRTRLPNGDTIECVNKSDAALLYDEIFVREVYGQHGIRIKEGDCVVDVGANIGMFMWYLSRRFERCRYFGFEPIPGIYAALLANSRQLTDRPVVVRNIGVSNVAGEASFEYLPRIPCCSTMYPNSTPDDFSRAERFTEFMMEETASKPVAALFRMLPRFAKTRLRDAILKYYGKVEQVSCQLKPLSQLIDEEEIDRIDLLKIDAERAEWDILRGIEARHWPLIQQMIVEVHWKDGEPYESILRLLKDQGLRVVEKRNPYFDETPVLYASRD